MSHMNKFKTNKQNVDPISIKSKINKQKIGIIDNDQQDYKTLQQQIMCNNQQIWDLIQSLVQQQENFDYEQAEISNNLMLMAINKYFFATLDSFFPKPEDFPSSNCHYKRKRSSKSEQYNNIKK